MIENKKYKNGRKWLNNNHCRHFLKNKETIKNYKNCSGHLHHRFIKAFEQFDKSIFLMLDEKILELIKELIRVFKDVNLIENIGSGVLDAYDKINDKETQILKALNENAKLTIPELNKITKISTATISRYLKQLQDKK